MKEIKNEIQKLLELLEHIKSEHNDFINYEINKILVDASGGNIQNDENFKENIDFGDKFKLILASRGNENLHIFQKNLIKNHQTILDIAINLNKLLDKPIKKVQSLEEIQHKKLLSIKEVEELYGFSKTQQQNYRSRLKNPLPRHKESTKSKSANTKVYYKKEELDDWIDNFL